MHGFTTYTNVLTLSLKLVLYCVRPNFTPITITRPYYHSNPVLKVCYIQASCVCSIVSSDNDCLSDRKT
jgi:hypothetical protein